MCFNAGVCLKKIKKVFLPKWDEVDGRKKKGDVAVSVSTFCGFIGCAF